VPLLFAAPKYLSGELTLGQVTQLAGAFIAVQGAISWVVDNFNRIAEWYASARRVMDIVDACDAADALHSAAAGSGISRPTGTSAGVSLSGVSVSDPRGAPIITGITFVAEPGTSTHIAGDTSTGKTTLVRALAGLWSKGGGSVSFPADARVIILPQKPYLPLGTLYDTLAYPEAELMCSEGTIADALGVVGLSALAGQLRETMRWDQQLSNGERQRLAMARVLLQAPDVLVLDDALSALDAASQVELMKALRAALPNTIIISLGQTRPPAGLHDQVLTMAREGGTATIRPPETPAIEPPLKQKV
jgi:putative ATP-binding cassette transporter